VIVLEQGTLEIKAVIARGKQMIRDGKMLVTEKFLERSARRITLYGQKQ
jgi:hypothetical protein